jgi:hypothetical protein
LAGDVPDSIEGATLHGRKQGKSGVLRLDIPNVAHFLIENGNRITYQRASGCDDETLKLFILGSCMGALLQQRGFIVLHGNAVSVDQQTCSIFVGDRGAGKSTMAGWHYVNQAWVLADDVCAVFFDTDGRPMVTPSFPQIKLWQESADLLGIDTSTLSQVRSGFHKFTLPVSDRFVDTPLPLLSVIELVPSLDASYACTGLEKVALLKRHCYRGTFLPLMALSKSTTLNVFKLAEKISAFRQNRLHITEKVN